MTTSLRFKLQHIVNVIINITLCNIPHNYMSFIIGYRSNTNSTKILKQLKKHYSERVVVVKCFQGDDDVCYVLDYNA